nr:DMT family transporter [Chthonobacter albigriseus]
MIVLSEQTSGFSGSGATGGLIGSLFALSSAVFAALAMVTVRELTATESTGAIVFYFSASASAMALLSIPFGWVVPTGMEAFILILAGLCGGVGQVLMTEAYRHAEASVIAPFDYANMIWIVIIAYLVFGDVPTGPVVLGSLIVIGSGVFVIWRERQLGLLKRKAEARKANTPV